MKNHEEIGVIEKKYSPDKITDKFTKTEFVLKVSSGNFDEYLVFQLAQNKQPILDDIETGSEVRVDFCIKGRKWENEGKIKYFTNLEAWQVEMIY